MPNPVDSAEDYERDRLDFASGNLRPIVERMVARKAERARANTARANEARQTPDKFERAIPAPMETR